MPHVYVFIFYNVLCGDTFLSDVYAANAFKNFNDSVKCQSSIGPFASLELQL